MNHIAQTPLVYPLDCKSSCLRTDLAHGLDGRFLSSRVSLLSAEFNSLYPGHVQLDKDVVVQQRTLLPHIESPFLVSYPHFNAPQIIAQYAHFVMHTPAPGGINQINRKYVVREPHNTQQTPVRKQFVSTIDRSFRTHETLDRLCNPLIDSSQILATNVNFPCLEAGGLIGGHTVNRATLLLHGIPSISQVHHQPEKTHGQKCGPTYSLEGKNYLR